jgi:hypothetical protein
MAFVNVRVKDAQATEVPSPSNCIAHLEVEIVCVVTVTVDVEEWYLVGGGPSTKLDDVAEELAENYKLRSLVSSRDDPIGRPEAETQVRNTEKFLDFGREQQKKMDALAPEEDDVNADQTLFVDYV